MTPARRCYIHVGLPKTGTSYVQSIFWQSREALAGQGLQMLPRTERETFQMVLALRGQLVRGMDPPAAFSAYTRFVAAAAGAASPDALVSQELLGGATPKQVARLLRDLAAYEPHVVVTVRDLATWAPSAWQQHVQARGTKELDVFLDDLAGLGTGSRPAAYDLHGVLDRWGSAVPPDRVHIVTVPKAGGQRLLLDRFCSVVGVDPDVLDTETAAANQSLGHVQAELLRRVNVALGDRLPHRRAGYREQGKRFLAGEVLRPQRGEPARLPPRLAGWCVEASADIVARLERSGYDIVGDLDDLVPDPAVFTAEARSVSDGELTEAAAAALATVLEKRAEDHQELARLRSRVLVHRRRLEELTGSSRPRWRMALAAARRLRTLTR